MTPFTSKLLASKRSVEFEATLSAHGLYSTDHYVLRLSPRIHRLLSEAQDAASTDSFSFDHAQAMSTYLHETMHWWQHVGSTYGFILSLSSGVPTYANLRHLRRILDLDGFQKSILARSSQLHEQGAAHGMETPSGLCALVVNNDFDVEVFRRYTLGRTTAETLASEPLFESVGHGIQIAYSNAVGIMASSVDEGLTAFPDPRSWGPGFGALRDRREEGYYYGSPITIWPVGSREIFEGQAQFAQLQYLAQAYNHEPDWDAYREVGMLHGVYIEAFEVFLRLTESDWPKHTNDPLVGLFLAVCDLAINPGLGFPFSVAPFHDHFLNDVVPGARFTALSWLIGKKLPQLKKLIIHHSRSEYDEVTETLSNAFSTYSPLRIAHEFSSWFGARGPLSALRKEYEAYDFDARNFLVRHLLAHFLAFQESKLQHPHFFCWPGAHMSGRAMESWVRPLFERHEALFVDKEDADGVYPRLHRDRSEKIVHDVFDNFYANACVFDLVSQWTRKPGRFDYDLKWLSPDASQDERGAFQRRHFKNAFGVDPEAARILAA